MRLQQLAAGVLLAGPRLRLTLTTLLATLTAALLTALPTTACIDRVHWVSTTVGPEFLSLADMDMGLGR